MICAVEPNVASTYSKRSHSVPLVAETSESDKWDSKGAQILCGGRELLADHVEEFQLKGFGICSQPHMSTGVPTGRRKGSPNKLDPDEIPQESLLSEIVGHSQTLGGGSVEVRQQLLKQLWTSNFTRMSLSNHSHDNTTTLFPIS